MSGGDKVVGLLTNISKEEVVESFIADFRTIVLGILEARGDVI